MKLITTVALPAILSLAATALLVSPVYSATPVTVAPAATCTAIAAEQAALQQALVAQAGGAQKAAKRRGLMSLARGLAGSALPMMGMGGGTFGAIGSIVGQTAGQAMAAAEAPAAADPSATAATSGRLVQLAALAAQQGCPAA